MLTVTAVLTAHANPDGLRDMVRQLHEQTRPPDEILVYVSDVAPDDLHGLDVTAVTLCPDRQDWGHEKRAQGLHDATCDLVGFFNDDDAYHPSFIEKMVDGIGDRDLVMCAFRSRLVGVLDHPRPQVGSCTSGNFLARRQLAQQVGWTHRVYDGDGRFIMDLVAAGATWCTIPDRLYEHR